MIDFLFFSVFSQFDSGFRSGVLLFELCLLCVVFFFFFSFSGPSSIFSSISRLLLSTQFSFYLFLSMVFVFLLVINLFGLIPYGFSLSRQVWVVIFFSLVFFFSFVLLLLRRGVFSFVIFFLPSGSPLVLGLFLFYIEILSVFVRPLTLTLRLCANMVTGHVLFCLLSSLTVSVLLVRWAGVFLIRVGLVLFFFELFVCFIQAVVFFLLLDRYFSEVN